MHQNILKHTWIIHNILISVFTHSKTLTKRENVREVIIILTSTFELRIKGNSFLAPLPCILYWYIYMRTPHANRQSHIYTDIN